MYCGLNSVRGTLPFLTCEKSSAIQQTIFSKTTAGQRVSKNSSEHLTYNGNARKKRYAHMCVN